MNNNLNVNNSYNNVNNTIYNCNYNNGYNNNLKKVKIRYRLYGILSIILDILSLKERINICYLRYINNFISSNIFYD